MSGKNNSVILLQIALMKQFYDQEIMMSAISVKFLDKITADCILYRPSVKIHFQLDLLSEWGLLSR
jgi:hypothetical protein